MRDIKFRGKREDANVWVYGYVFKTHKGNPWFDETTWIFNEDGKFKVEPETVGQYTNLYDKTGVEIYEDDILHYIGTRFERFSAIRYAGKGKYIDYDVILPVRFEDNKGFQMYQQGIGYLEIFHPDVEVIGNIHKNPELLEPHT